MYVNLATQKAMYWLATKLSTISGRVSGVDPGFSEGGANDGKGEWGVPPPTQSREAFAIIVCD